LPRITAEASVASAPADWAIWTRRQPGAAAWITARASRSRSDCPPGRAGTSGRSRVVPRRLRVPLEDVKLEIAQPHVPDGEGEGVRREPFHPEDIDVEAHRMPQVARVNADVVEPRGPHLDTERRRGTAEIQRRPCRRRAPELDPLPIDHGLSEVVAEAYIRSEWSPPTRAFVDVLRGVTCSRRPRSAEVIS